MGRLVFPEHTQARLLSPSHGDTRALRNEVTT
jgi:hypothetical protein